MLGKHALKQCKGIATRKTFKETFWLFKRFRLQSFDLLSMCEQNVAVKNLWYVVVFVLSRASILCFIYILTASRCFFLANYTLAY